MSLRILQVFKIHMLHFPRAYWVRLFNPSSCRPLILRCLSNPGPLHTRLATIEAHTCVGQAASDKSPSLHRRFIRQHPASGHTTYILTAIRFALSAVFPTDLAKCQEPIVEACKPGCWDCWRDPIGPLNYKQYHIVQHTEAPFFPLHLHVTIQSGATTKSK